MGIIFGKGIVVGRGYWSFLTEMSARTTKVTTALLLVVQDVKNVGKTKKAVTISAASIESHVHEAFLPVRTMSPHETVSFLAQVSRHLA